MVVGTDNRFIKAGQPRRCMTRSRKKLVFIRSGGSIPIVTDFQDVLKIPSVMMGFGLPDDNLTRLTRSFIFRIFIGGLNYLLVL